MKKPLLLLVLMQLGVINNKMSAQDYSFDEGVGARNALNYLPDGLTGKGVLVGVIAAGSYGADGWHGIAPEASLLCDQYRR